MPFHQYLQRHKTHRHEDPVLGAAAKENLSHRYSQIFTKDLKFLNDQNLRTLSQCLSVKISGEKKSAKASVASSHKAMPAYFCPGAAG
ncbi:MAG TPA: hypothetical protein ENJ89_10035 [Caldithrix abyssi]|uniref:Uncharacterized protein n=1 Tax=Caldithrix abyssi TaxID=187145 RepID=A0A7V5PRE9_CALAY|nr:hypothetical protein [Caldithrix abyssi]